MRKFYPVVTALLYLLCTFMYSPVSAEYVSDKTFSGKTQNSAYENLTTSIFHHVTFTNNKVTTNGAGIWNKNAGVISLIDGSSKFEENHAKYGGAIYNYKTATIGTISDTIFERNTARAQGGAIYSAGFLNHIENSQFISNDAWGDTTSGAGYGGAIYANKNLIITNSTFRDNHAYRKGGAIALMSGDLTIEAKGSGAKSEFTNNVQGYLGSSSFNDEGNDVYMGGSNQKLYLNAYDSNSEVILNSGIDFNKGLNLYINKPDNQNEVALGIVQLGGDVGSSSKRVNLFLNGGTMTFINNEINRVYANKVTINSDTKLGFDVNLMTGELAYDQLYLNSVTGSGRFVITSDSFNIMSNFTEESESAVLRLIYSSSSAFKSYINMFDEEGNKTNIIYIMDEDGVTKLYKVKLASDGTLIFSNVNYIDQITNPLAYAVNYEGDTSYTLTLTKNIIADSWEDIDPGVPRNKLIVDDLYIIGKNKTITAENNLVGIDVDNSIADPGVPKYLNVNSAIFTGFDRAIINNGGLVDLYYTGFKGNTSKQKGNNGAALSNISGTMNVIGTAKKTKSIFYNNEAVNGGAVYNSGTMEISYSAFGAVPTKKATYSNIATNGGAIYNVQSDIPSEYTDTGLDTNLKVTNTTFVNNIADKGGAIYNIYADETTATETVKITNSTFTHNQAKDLGGAIYNEGNLEVITSNFGNKSKKASYANTAVNGGAAVANKGEGRYVSSNSNYYYSSGDNGGAILNTDNATAIIQGGTFANNSATNGNRDGSKGNGGAIYNDENGTLSLDRYTYYTISKGNTVERYAYLTFSANTALNGGAIYNLGSLVPSGYDIYGMPIDIAGTFSKNTVTIANQNYTINASQKEDSSVYISPKGGAIYNNGKLTLANASFNSNSANGKVTLSVRRYMDGMTPVTEQVTRYAGKGGAIYNESGENVNIINTTFSKNSAAVSGGAICNENENSILYITNSDFSSNSARTLVTTVQTQEIINGSKTKTKKVTQKEYVGDGGAIYSKTDVAINKAEEYKDLVRTTTFKSNTAVNGGAIYAEGKVDSYLANFTSNKANGGDGGAILSKEDVNIDNSTFSKNTATGIGGAIVGKNVDVVDSTFSGNKANDNGGAIYADGNVTVNAHDYEPDSSGASYVGASTFSSNSALNGGAIYATGSVLVKDTTFTSNKASKGNGGAIYAGGDIRVVNSTFNKNSASYGGAVYVEAGKTATFINTSFTNNSASKAGGAIYVGNGSTVNIIAYDRDVTISGNKAAGKANSIFIDDNAKVYLDAWDHTESGGGRYTITLSDGVTGTGINNQFWLRGNGNFKITSNITNIEHHDETTIGAHIILDVESLIQASSMYFSGNSTFVISNNRIGRVAFKTLGLPDDTTTNVSIDMDLKKGESDKITAETVEGNGILSVNKVNLTNNSKTPVSINVGEGSEISDISTTTAESAEATYKLKQYLDSNGRLMAVAYGQKAKPCALAAPVAAQIGGYLTQINSYDQAFMNMDMNMLKTREERQSERLNNRYASSDSSYTAYSEDNGINLNSKGLWTRPYATFERVNLNNGPKVSNIGYGNFFGGDAEVKELNNGWKRQFSAYVGYNGSIQDYDRQSIDQNGGTLGVTEVWYKNNFFTGLTANVGANSVNANTDLGNENFPMLMAGIASKSGYNFEFKDGKFVIQPSLLLSYSFVHTFSHDNGRGNKVGSSPLHAIQVAPGVKFIFNLPKGWQPYLGVNMRWNIIDKTHFSLQDVSIPDMSIDPYVEYGIGIQRRWGERFTGYGQAMIRNGGRNGVMLSFGFKWAIGK